MPPRKKTTTATKRKAAAITVDDDPVPPTPPKRAKKTEEDSELFSLTEEESAAQMVLPGRNRFESCDKHAHPSWDSRIDGIKLMGCMHRCEICGENLPRNLMRHVKTNHCYDPSGQTKNIPTTYDDKSVLWNINKITGPGKGGQKVFPLDIDDSNLIFRAAQITKAGTAEGGHLLNKSDMARVNKQTMYWQENPVTGKTGSAYKKAQNAEKRANASAAPNSRNQALRDRS